MRIGEMLKPALNSLFARRFSEFFSLSDNTIISTLVVYFRRAVRVHDHIDYRLLVGYGSWPNITLRGGGASSQSLSYELS